MRRRVRLRWQDLDALGHVGHTAVIVLLEEGRDAFLEGLVEPDEYVVGRCSVSFNREIPASQREVEVECLVEAIGSSSITTRERILAADGAAAVEAEFTIVLWDAERRASRPITDAERTSLEAEGSPR